MKDIPGSGKNSEEREKVRVANSVQDFRGEMTSAIWDILTSLMEENGIRILERGKRFITAEMEVITPVTDTVAYSITSDGYTDMKSLTAVSQDSSSIILGGYSG